MPEGNDSQATDHQLTRLGNEAFNVPAIARYLDAEAKAVYGGSERTQIELVARLVRAQQTEIERLVRELAEVRAELSTHEPWRTPDVPVTRQADITDVRPLDLEQAKRAVAHVIEEERRSEVSLPPTRPEATNKGE